jgi:ribosomal protein L37E
MSGKRKPEIWRRCDRCGEEFHTREERYCKPCRKAIRAELRESGYLTPLPQRRIAPSTNNFNPHLDEENPSFEDTVRRLEDTP